MEWVSGIVRVITAVAPGLIAAWTGHEDDAAAIDHLDQLVAGLKTREDHGEWDRDLAARRDRIARDKRSEDDTREVPR